MTPEGHRALLDELAARRAERHRTVEVVAWAAGNGDRSENADYKEGKRRLRELDRRLRTLGQRLERAEIVDPADQRRRDRIFFGATVTYRSDASGLERTVVLVGVDEADARRGRISIASPIGRALLGRSRGDAVALETPGGRDTLEILRIDYPDPAGGRDARESSTLPRP